MTSGCFSRTTDKYTPVVTAILTSLLIFIHRSPCPPEPSVPSLASSLLLALVPSLDNNPPLAPAPFLGNKPLVVLAQFLASSPRPAAAPSRVSNLLLGAARSPTRSLVRPLKLLTRPSRLLPRSRPRRSSSRPGSSTWPAKAT